MKSWQRHFILGIIIGLISLLLIKFLLNSVPEYNEDGNLLVTIFVLLTYGVGTTILGEFLMTLDKKIRRTK